jgi:hypothetical protein
MHHISIKTILANLKLFFGMQIVVDGNRPNPVYLALATSGYRIQSQRLRIPDRYGFFAAAPPRVQVEEGLACAHLCMSISGAIWCGWFTISHGSFSTARSFAVAVSLMIFEIATIAVIWYLTCTDPRREPDYVWKNGDEIDVKGW